MTIESQGESRRREDLSRQYPVGTVGGSSGIQTHARFISKRNILHGDNFSLLDPEDERAVLAHWVKTYKQLVSLVWDDRHWD